jgi:hypothetical protein
MDDQSAATSFSHNLPLLPEIWLQILTHLTHHDIQSASLTCQSLRQMAQPLLFHTLTFFPYTFDRHREIRHLPSVDVIQRTLHKLFFCSSNQLIAPAVKRLIICPILEPISEDGDQNENLIIDHILNALHNFVNLAAVLCHHIWFTSQHLINLSKLGKLRLLGLTDCRLDIPADSPITPSVSHLAICSLTLPSDDWFSYFHPDTVSLTVGGLYTSVLPALVISPSTIPYLRSLSTTVNRETLPLLVAVLTHKPPLRSLRLNTSEMTGCEIHAVSFTPSPLLDTFQGPPVFLQSICTTKSLRNLRHLQLSSLSPQRNDEPDDVKFALVSLGESAAGLETLRFSVRYLTEDLLKTTVSLCHNLKKLSISAVERERVPPDPDAYTVPVCFPSEELSNSRSHLI